MKVMFAMRSIIILFLFSLFLTSCANTLYIGELAWGEANILGEAVPNEDAFRNGLLLLLRRSTFFSNSHPCHSPKGGIGYSLRRLSRYPITFSKPLGRSSS
jgi:hypothetical protein